MVTILEKETLTEDVSYVYGGVREEKFNELMNEIENTTK